MSIKEIFALLLAAILGSTLLTRLLDMWSAWRGKKRQDDTAITLSKDDELREIRRHLAEQANALQVAKDQLLTEKLALERQAFTFEQELKFERVFSQEREKRIKTLESEKETIHKNNERLIKIILDLGAQARLEGLNHE